jgi:starvation-inducible DNA-binding protein
MRWREDAVSLTSTRTTDLDVTPVVEISEALRLLLADVFALFVKTKSFHWHIGGRHFREDHLLLDDHATQIFGMIDEIAERIRKIGGAALHSIGDIAQHQRLKDNNGSGTSATNMLRELLDDNRQLTTFFCLAHEVCDRHRDVATASLIENWIDESQQRVWFLDETTSDR